MSDTTSTPAKPSTDTAYGWGAPVIATISVVELIVFGALALWLKNDNLLLLIGGAVVANSTTAVGYYLGSSRSSQIKDNTIAAQLPAPPPVTAPPAPAPAAPGPNTIPTPPGAPVAA